MKKILEEMRKKRESFVEKGKKVEVEYEENLPVVDKNIEVKDEVKDKPRPFSLEDKVNLLIKLVFLLLLLNVGEIMYKIIF